MFALGAVMAIAMAGACPYFEVFDMRTSMAFYCDVLGFSVAQHSPFYAEGEFHWCLLRHEGIELMLNTAYDEGERPAEPDAARTRVHGDTCLFIGCQDVDVAYEELTSKGLKLKQPKVAPYGMKQLYLSDPDGYGLCLQTRV
jgi:glyoxylase I family protein